MTRDHIVPQQMGGGGGQYNLVPSCAPCNTRKAHRWPACECDKCELARWLFIAKSDPVMRAKVREYGLTLQRIQRIRHRVRTLGPNALFTSNARKSAEHLDWLMRGMRRRERDFVRTMHDARTYRYG